MGLKKNFILPLILLMVLVGFFGVVSAEIIGVDITSPPSGSYISGIKTITWSLIGTDEAGDRYNADYSPDGVVWTSINSQPLAPGSTSINWNTDSLNGNYQIRVQHYNNGLKNYDIVTGIIVDNTKPTATISDVSGSWTNSDIITLGCSDNIECSTTRWYYFDSDGVCSSSKTDYINSISGGSLTVSTTHNDYLCLWVEDKAGNSQYTTAGSQLKVDATNPTAGLTISPTGLTNQNTVTYTPTCSDAGGSELASCTTYVKFNDEIPTSISTAQTAVQIYTMTNDGTYTFYTVAIDNAGNNVQTSNYEVQRDITAPVISITNAPTTTWNVGSSVNVEKSCDDSNAQIKYYYSDTSVVCSTKNFDNDYITSNAATKPYVCAAAKDTAGNIGYSNLAIFKISPTIQGAINSATSGDTINVASGIYTEVGQIVINKNLNIIGADKATTIIKTNQDTTNSGDTKGWFLVNSGFTFNLQKVTLDGSGHKIFQAIRDYGIGTIEDCKFTNIKYNPSGTDYAGTAIVAFIGSSGSVDVKNSEFSEIGRVGVLYFGTGKTGTYSGNTYTGKGVGNWLDYGVEVGAGAQAIISNNIISNCKGVASSDGSTSAGILVTTYYGAGTAAEIQDNLLHDNTAGIAVGYGTSDTSIVIINNRNEIYNNDYGIEAQKSPLMSLTVNENQIYSNSIKAIDATDGPVVNAESNWWGTNVGSTIATKILGNVDYTPWAYNANLNTDNVVPTTTINSPVASSWYKTDFSVSVSDSDTGGAGLGSCNYRILSNDVVTKVWTSRTCNSQVTVTVGAGLDCRDEGTDKCKIEAYAIDNSGNQGATVSRTFGVDLTAPTVSAGTDKITKVQVSQDATVSDTGGSVISTYQWAKVSGPGTVTFGTANAEDTTISANLDGVYIIRLTVTDNAGNSAYDEVSFTWDTTGPTTSDNYGTKNGNWQNADQTITLTPTDATSPVASTKYCTSITDTCTPSTGTDYTTSVTILAEGTTYFRYQSIDSAGNIQDVVSRTVKIDKTNPIVTINAVTTPTKTTPQTITGTFTETNINTITVNGVSATIGTGTYSVSVILVEGDNTITTTATDLAGRIGTSSASINLDITAPVISNLVPGDKTISVGQTVTFTLTATDANNVANVKLYNETGGLIGDFVHETGNSWSYTSAAYNTKGDYKYYIKATDSVNNEKREPTTTYTIKVNDLIWDLLSEWNLVSAPKNLVDNSMPANEVWQYHSATGWTRSTTITPGVGYWINNAPTTSKGLDYAGGCTGPFCLPSGEIDISALEKGEWNLIGITTTETGKTVGGIFKSPVTGEWIPGLYYIISYNEDTGRFNDFLTATNIMNPGEGYWVYVVK